MLSLAPGARSAPAAQRYEPAVEVAPGIFLAEAPEGEKSASRQAFGDGPQIQVVGGDATTIAEWPWQAAITYHPDDYPTLDGFERQFCGGSLVTPTIIVTAAHCVYDSGTWQPATAFASITGRTTLSDSSEGQEIAWSDYYFLVDGSGTPLYDPSTDAWDVVFAELVSPSPASNSTPIQIAGADEAAFWAPGDENAWATGWGTTSWGGSRSDTLQEVNIDVIADSSCASAYGSWFEPETMLCAGELAGGQDTCQGDSGGPLVTPVGTGGGAPFRLIGDTSWGGICAEPETPGVYGRLAREPMCGALRSAIQTVAGVDVVGPGGCLPAAGPPPSISIADVSVIEGSSGQSAAELAVSLSHASGEEVTVPYATADGSATSGSDYDSQSGTLTFSPGQTSKQVSVPVNGDTLDEPDETFKVDLSAPTGATISDGHAIGTIVDDDEPPSTGDGTTETGGETGDSGGETGGTAGGTAETADGTGGTTGATAGGTGETVQTPRADVTAPDLVARAKRRQRAGRAIRVRTSSNEDAVLVATGKVFVRFPAGRRASLTRRAGRTFKLRTARTELEAGERAQLLKLVPRGTRKRSRRARNSIARMVRRGGKATGRITIRVTDAAGNSSTRRLKVRLKR